MLIIDSRKPCLERLVPAIFLALGLMSVQDSARAVPMSFGASDTSGPILITSNAPFGVSLDLKSDGFNPATDTILGLVLLVALTDDPNLGPPDMVNDPDDLIPDVLDRGIIVVDGNPIFALEVGTPSVVTFDQTDLAGLVPALQADGVWEVIVAINPGTPFPATDDFLYLASELRVVADRVPEPATLLLIGMGLIGIWSGRRRQFSNG